MIDKAKLLEWLGENQYMFIGLYEYKMLKKEIESGTFDLIPTDVEIEGLTWEDLPQIRIKLRDDKHVSTSEIYALVNAVGTLWGKLAEKEASVNWWMEQYYEQARLNARRAELFAEKEAEVESWKREALLQARLYAAKNEKLNQAVEALEKVVYFADRDAFIPAGGVARQALQSIKGTHDEDPTR